MRNVSIRVGCSRRAPVIWTWFLPGHLAFFGDSPCVGCNGAILRMKMIFTFPDRLGQTQLGDGWVVDAERWLKSLDGRDEKVMMRMRRRRRHQRRPFKSISDIAKLRSSQAGYLVKTHMQSLLHRRSGSNQPREASAHYDIWSVGKTNNPALNSCTWKKWELLKVFEAGQTGIGADQQTHSLH